MKSVAFVTYSVSPRLTPSDQLVANELKKWNIEVTSVPWDKKDVHWDNFNLIIIRSTWNYHLKIEEFKLWLNKLEQVNIRVYNSIDLIRWNIDKRYLFDLENQHISIPKTFLITDLADLNQFLNNINILQFPNIVIKPIYGASAYNIFKFNLRDLHKVMEKITQLIKLNPVLIQEYLPEIESQGELSFIFFNNQFSHAVRKTPKNGDFRVNYRLGGQEKLYIAGEGLITQAFRVLQVIDKPYIYARIDAINLNGQLLLMELELIDPHLFLDLYQPGAVLFAKAIKNKLE